MIRIIDKMTRIVLRKLSLAGLDDRGAAAVEFSIMAPLFLLIMMGILDLGGGIYSKMRMDTAVNSSAMYALTRGDAVIPTSSAALADQLIEMLAVELGSEGIEAEVTVNNGSRSALTYSKKSATGASANANKCYCPTRNGDTIRWNEAGSCGSPCSSGGNSGKFIAINVSRQIRSLLPLQAIIGDSLNSQAIVQVQ